MQVKKLNERAILPSRGSAKAAGFDLSSVEEILIPGNCGKALIPTGWSVAVPQGTYGRVAPRSGLAWNKNIMVNAGVIDRDYRGEVKVILVNLSPEPFLVKVGDRVAQLILECNVTPPVTEVAILDETSRSEKGFGSSGVSL